MRETLEDRVTWEQTESGIRIAIPVRRGPFAGLYGPLVLFWLILATIHYWKLLAGPHPEDINFLLQKIAIGIYGAGFVYFLCWLAWITTGETLVTLHPPTVRIQTRVLGIDVSSRSFRTNQIHRIHFSAHTKMLMQRSVVNPNSSCIRFDVNNRRQSFARGVTENEARAMIDKMLQVYQFPRSWF